jgi:cephalosporin-C deacetylase-like acetyl esterase
MKIGPTLANAVVALCVSLPLAAAPSTDGADTPIAPVPPGVALRAATVRVIVAPDHRDWTYKLGEPVRFAVSVTADNEPIDGVTVTYTLGPDMFPGEEKTAALPLTGMTIDGGSMTEPGFLRCIVSTKVAGRSYRGLGTAAFAPEKIAPTQEEPPDFDAFWQSGREELAKIPIEARTTLIPDACTSTVDVYQVSIRTVGGSAARVYGILCEPREPGKYPAVLQVPGAGVRPYGGDPNLASKGAIVLQIGIHGIPVNLSKEVYDNLASGALNAYWLSNLDDRDHFYYRRVYLSCIRANDFLTSLPNWDGKRLVVMGGSQGGQLTIVTAGLDSRVTGLSASYPAFCDVSGELHHRAGGWPHPFMPQAGGTPSVNATAAKIATASYYDSVNFARRIRAPGYYDWGYNDEVCPPTASYAAYNVMTAPKTLGLSIECGHAQPVEQSEQVTSWVEGFLGLK